MKYKYGGKEWEIGPIKCFKWKTSVKFCYRNISGKKYDVNVLVTWNENGNARLVLPQYHDYPKIFVNLVNKLNKENFTLKDDEVDDEEILA